MKQGDVIRPLLFNAGLEHALRKWKQKLKHHGLLVGARERLTNIRFADDLMLYAKTLREIVKMLELLLLESFFFWASIECIQNKKNDKHKLGADFVR